MENTGYTPYETEQVQEDRLRRQMLERRRAAEMEDARHPYNTEIADTDSRLRQLLLDREARDYAPGTDEMGEDPRRGHPLQDDPDWRSRWWDETRGPDVLREWEEANDRPSPALDGEWGEKPETMQDVLAKWRRMDEEAKPKLLYTGGNLGTPELEGDVGYDLIVKDLMWIGARSFARVPMEARVAIPKGHWGLVIARSSTNAYGRMLVFPGVVDAGYRGPLFAFVLNLTDEQIGLNPGMSICQLVLVPAAVVPAIAVDVLPASERGLRGFGSTGISKAQQPAR